MIRKLIFSLLPLALLALLTSEQMSQNGRAGRTGSPGETTCTNCHSSFSVNSGGGSISIQSPGMTNFQYTPGQTYNMSVTVARTGNSLFGVGIEALTSANDNAGTLTITDVAASSIKNATVSGISRHNIVHKTNGGASVDSKVFNFSWTAPTTGTGAVTFYFSGIAANGNGSESGDYVYAGSQSITEVSCQSPIANVTMAGDTLYGTTGTSYEWYLNGNFITGATNSYYVPTQNGTYTLVVYNGTCAGTSAPFAYTTLGINSFNNTDAYSVYLNPSSKILTLNAVNISGNNSLMIFDISGRTISQTVIHDGENFVDLNGISEGVYTVCATNGNNKMVKRIILSN